MVQRPWESAARARYPDIRGGAICQFRSEMELLAGAQAVLRGSTLGSEGSSICPLPSPRSVAWL